MTRHIELLDHVLRIPRALTPRFSLRGRQTSMDFFAFIISRLKVIRSLDVPACFTCILLFLRPAAGFP